MTLDDDHVCRHGTAVDVHCCDCGRSGFLFNADDCVCSELQDIRKKRGAGELIGPLSHQYGAELVVRALGVMTIARALGVTEYFEPFINEEEDRT